MDLVLDFIREAELLDEEELSIVGLIAEVGFLTGEG